MPFLDLPVEIRVEILAYVVSTSSGIIFLKQGTSSYGLGKPRYTIVANYPNETETISLSFLRTCKKIYAEGKDLLWQRNTLDIEALVPVRYMRPRGPLMADISHQLTSRVQAVQMEMHFTDFSTLSGEIAITGQGRGGPGELVLFHTLRALGSWVSLKSLTLVMREGTDTIEGGPQTLGRAGLRTLMSNRGRPVLPGAGQSLYHEHLDILRYAIEEDVFPNVERQVKMAFGKPNFWDDFEDIEDFGPYGDPNNVLEEIGTAFKCPVIVDDEICFKNSVFLHKPFTSTLGSISPNRFHLEGDFVSEGRPP
jgi:hypothetical protein